MTNQDTDPDTRTIGRASRVKRLWLIFGAIFVVVTVGITAVVLATTGKGDRSAADVGPSEECVSSTAQAQADATSSSSPPKEGDVEVTDDGIMTTGSMDDEYVGLNFGVVLQNSSSLVAKDVTIEFDVTTKDGNPGLDEYGDPLDLETVIVPFIYPGEEFGTGSDAYIDTDGIEDGLTLNTTVEVDQWWEVENRVHEFAKMSGEILGRIKDSNSRIEFSMRSEYCDPVTNAAASVLYRNSAGDIIGGYSRQSIVEVIDSKPVDIEPVEEYAPGRTDSLVTDNVWYIKNDRETDEQVDLSTSSIYPYSDPTEKDDQ